MARYILTGPQQQILTSWLYEVGGYLDLAVNVVGVSARQALAANPGLDVTAWLRTQTPAPEVSLADWDGCSMVWWMQTHHGVDITPATRPPETPVWVSTLEAWQTSIAQGLAHHSEAVRNQSHVPITAEDGRLSEMPAGSHLVQQNLCINRVLEVLA